MAICMDLIPTDQQTLDDYGFTKAFTWKRQTMLFGVYVVLVKSLEVGAGTLYRWQINGTLLSKIKKRFARSSRHSGNQYLTWFMQNQWVLDPNQSAPETPREIREQELESFGYISADAVPRQSRLSEQSLQVGQGGGGDAPTSVTYPSGSYIHPIASRAGYLLTVLLGMGS